MPTALPIKSRRRSGTYACPTGSGNFLTLPAVVRVLGSVLYVYSALWISTDALNQRDLEALAAANALAALTGNRHQAAWSLAGVDLESPLFLESPIQEATPILRVPTEGQNIAADYMSVGLTLRRHPLALLRERFQRRQIKSAHELNSLETQTHVRIAGLVLVRQSPGTAHNTTFMTLEDETGVVNVIVWGSISENYRRPFLQAQLLEVGGRLQHEKGVMHVIAEDLVDRSAWLGALRAPARDFR
jgi:error-prone DNA polymerase